MSWDNQPWTKAHKWTLALSWLLFLGTLAIMTAGIISVVKCDAHVSKVSSIKYRAAVASTADGMSALMADYRAGIVCLADGRDYISLVYDNEASSVTAMLDNIDRIRERADALNGISRDTTAYQLGLDDLRETIQNLNDLRFLWVSTWWWIPVIIGFWVFAWAFIIFTGVGWRDW